MSPDEIVINLPNEHIQGAEVRTGVSYVGVKWTTGMTLTGYTFDRDSAIAVLRVHQGSLIVRVECRHGSPR